MDCSSSGSSVHGILQARILEWVAIPFSRGSSWPRGQTQVFCTVGRFFAIWAIEEALFGWWLDAIYVSYRTWLNFVSWLLGSNLKQAPSLKMMLIHRVCFWCLNEYAVLCLGDQLCPTLCDPMDCNRSGSSVHGDSLCKNTGVGCHAFLRGIFPIHQVVISAVL